MRDGEDNGPNINASSKYRPISRQARLLVIWTPPEWLDHSAKPLRTSRKRLFFIFILGSLLRSSSLLVIRSYCGISFEYLHILTNAVKASA